MKSREGQAHVQQGRVLVGQGDFSGALRENEKVLALTPDKTPADAALYEMALIRANPANAQMDYRKALQLFRQVQSRFPQSRFAQRAAIWIPFLEKEVSAEHEARLHLQRMQGLTRQGRFSDAAAEDEKLIAVKSRIADAALLNLGLIFTDPENPGHDHKRALEYFSQLVTEYPKSRHADEARIWCGILREEFSAEREGSALLQRVRLLIRQEKFDEALRESQSVLSRAPKSSPGDAALFCMSLVWADRSNPRFDIRRAITLLVQLEKEFPRSPLAEDARIWLFPLKGEVSAEREGQAYLQRMQALMRKGELEDAVRENQRVLSGDTGQPVDAALFSMGIIYADRAYPKRDYKKALGFFSRLRREYSGSQFVEEAKVWIGVLETMEKSLRVDLEIEQKKNQLRR